jgi:hypothetical protein
VIAEFGMIAEPSEAVWADRVEILLAKREVRTAETASRLVALSRRAARCAADHRRIMRRRLMAR